MRFKGLVNGIEIELEPEPACEGDGLESFGVDSEPSARFCSDLDEALTTEGEPAIKARFARNAIVVLEATRRSAKEGQTVYLDSAK